jgi:hypothetical protein
MMQSAQCLENRVVVPPLEKCDVWASTKCDVSGSHTHIRITRQMARAKAIPGILMAFWASQTDMHSSEELS